jgi:hypothetical protein
VTELREWVVEKEKMHSGENLACDTKVVAISKYLGRAISCLLPENMHPKE